MAKFGSYIQEAYDELVHKVSWPSWSELQSTTVVVLIALVLVTAIIFGMDAACEALMKFLYSFA